MQHYLHAKRKLRHKQFVNVDEDAGADSAPERLLVVVKVTRWELK